MVCDRGCNFYKAWVYAADQRGWRLPRNSAEAAATSASDNIVLLQHGTTLRRAERLLVTTPEPHFVDPGGDYYSRANGISFVIAGSADIGLGSVEKYARAKAANFPSEGGPVILEVEVPDAIVDILRNDPDAWMVVDSHEIRFEPGLGFEELVQAWPNLVKRITPL